MGDSRSHAADLQERQERQEQLQAAAKHLAGLSIETFATLRYELRWLKEWQSSMMLTEDDRARIKRLCALLDYKTGG